MFPNRFKMSVFKINIFITILLFGTFATATVPPQVGGTSSSTSSNVTISKHSVILVVSFDGFRADYLDKVETPAMDSLKASGVRVPYMEPVFPTLTFPNHQSIVTGLYAESHGIVGNSFFDPKYNKSLSGFTDDPGFWNYDPDVIPIWIRNEMAGDGRTSGCKLWSGSDQPYGKNGSLPTYYHPGYNSTVPWEDRVDTVISWMTNPSNPANLVFLYHEEPDMHGHAFGPNSPETLEEIKKTDNRTAYLVEKLKDVGIYDKINLILLSDHGTKEVTKDKVINITEIFDAQSNRIKRWFGSTPYRQVTAEEGKLEELFKALKEQSEAHNFTVWKTAEMRQPYFYSNSRRVMDLVVMANPGYAFDDFYESMVNMSARWNLTEDDSHEFGVHGYSNVYGPMRPFFLAHGPAFRRNLDHAPIRNVDIVPLISTILGIPVPPNNGSLDRVVRMIHPSYLPPSSGNRVDSMNCAFILGIMFILSKVCLE